MIKAQRSDTEKIYLIEEESKRKGIDKIIRSIKQRYLIV